MKTEFLKGYNEKETIEFFVAGNIMFAFVKYYSTHVRLLHHVSKQRRELKIRRPTQSFLTKFEVGEYDISMTIVF